MRSTTTIYGTLDHMAWQPIVNLHTLKILGHEALARFDEERSPLSVFGSADVATQIFLDQQCVA